MSLFPLLYKVFYDKKAVSDVIENGKGRGGGILFVLSLVSSVLFCVRFFIALSGFETAFVSDAGDSLPRVVFEKGVIVEPASFRYQFVSQNVNAFFSIDIPDDNPLALSALPLVGMRVIPSGVQVVNDSEVRFISFREMKINNLFLSPAEVKVLLSRSVKMLKITLAGMSFVFLLPLFFIEYVLFSYIFSVFSFAVSGALKTEPDYDGRMRMCVLAMIPPVLLNEAARLSGAHVFLNWWQGMLVAAVYLYIFMKERQTLVQKG